MRKLATLFALLTIAGCSKQSSEESSTMASASEPTGGAETSSSDGMTSDGTEPSDSNTYGTVTTRYSDTATEPGATDTQQQGTTGQQNTTAGASTDQTMGSDVDVEAIRTVLVTEYPNSADTIRAMTITENGGIVTLRGIVLDEREKPGIIAVVERVPGVKDVKDELNTQQSQGAQQ